MARSKKKMWIIAGAAASVVVVALFLGTRGKPATVVTAVRAHNGTIVATVSAPGSVDAVNEVQISSQAAGRIVNLPVQEGDTVKQGQLLVQIDSTTYRALLDQAKAALTLARASLNQSRELYNRSVQLYKSDLISKQDFQAAQTQYRLDSARVVQAEAGLQQAQDNLDYTTITSPIAGVITELSVKEGEQAVIGTMNFAGTVLMTVSDLSDMEVKCDVDESDVGSVKKGQDVSVQIDAYPDSLFRGKVELVGNAPVTPAGAPATTTTQSTSISYEITVRFTQPVPVLRPGMSATATITTAVAHNILMIPLQAIVVRPLNGQPPGASVAESAATQARPEQQVVFTIDSVFARMAPVTTGIFDDQNIQILSGVKDGQLVVTGPFEVLRGLQDGQRIRVAPQNGRKGPKQKSVRVRPRIMRGVGK